MRIHGSEKLGVAGEVAIASLAAEQEFQTVLDGFAVPAGEVSLAGAEKGEQGQARDAGISLSASAAAVVAERFGLAARAVGVGVPATVAALCFGEPFERGGDGIFGLCARAEGLRGLEAVGRDAGLQWLGHVEPIAQTARDGSLGGYDELLLAICGWSDGVWIGSQGLGLLGIRAAERIGGRRWFSARWCRERTVGQQIGQVGLS